MVNKKYGKLENLTESSNVSVKKCKRKFITELNYSEEFKREAIQILYEGNSGRAIGRIMGINKSTVYNWIKKLKEKIQKKHRYRG